MGRIVLAGWLLAASLALSAPADAAPIPQRLDPRLAAALVPGSEPVPVWVEFSDKGEQGPSDLAARLSQAERDLTPLSRARRIRNGVTPIVDYLDLPVSPGYLRTLEQAGMTPYGVSRWFNGCAVRASGAQLARLAALDGVRLVSPAPVAAPRSRQPVPADELTLAALPRGAAGALGTQVNYGLTAAEMTRLDVPALHDSGYIGAGILICMCDEGYNYFTKHNATRNIDVGNRTRDFVRGGTVVQDTVGNPSIFQHGQWTLSAIGGNAPGAFVGPAFGASFALARTEDSGSEKPIEMVNWLMASEWADSLGANIISSSLGYFTFPDSAGTSLTYAQLDGHTSIITRAVEIAAAKGILVVNSAGNDGPLLSTLDAPADANGDSMLAVGAVDATGHQASFSSNGPTADGRIKPDVMAQGVSVVLASASGAPSAYTSLSGTSFSCPLTAGVAACLMQARPNWTIVNIVHALKRTASMAGAPNNNMGWGIIDGLRALQWDTASVSPGGKSLRFALLSANPMRIGSGPALVRMALPEGVAGGAAELNVYDTLGRRVRAVWNGRLAPGDWLSLPWDGADESGHAVHSGLYFITFESGHHRSAIRLAAIR